MKKSAKKNRVLACILSLALVIGAVSVCFVMPASAAGESNWNNNGVFSITEDDNGTVLSESSSENAIATYAKPVDVTKPVDVKITVDTTNTGGTQMLIILKGSSLPVDDRTLYFHAHVYDNDTTTTLQHYHSANNWVTVNTTTFTIRFTPKETGWSVYVIAADGTENLIRENVPVSASFFSDNKGYVTIFSAGNDAASYTVAPIDDQSDDSTDAPSEEPKESAWVNNGFTLVEGQSTSTLFASSGNAIATYAKPVDVTKPVDVKLSFDTTGDGSTQMLVMLKNQPTTADDRTLYFHTNIYDQGYDIVFQNWHNGAYNAMGLDHAIIRFTPKASGWDVSIVSASGVETVLRENVAVPADYFADGKGYVMIMSASVGAASYTVQSISTLLPDDSDFAVVGSTMRNELIADRQGIRVGAAMELNADGKFVAGGAAYTVKEYGALLGLESKLADVELTYENSADVVAGSALKVCKSTAFHADSTDTNKIFTTFIYNIPQANKDTNIVFRPYVACEDGNGGIVYFYAESFTTSVSATYAAIVEAGADGNMSAEAKAWFAN